ncbi:MAG: crotonase/enoyl-CoA hydratase family protein [Actinomycetia bacterium]|nr:crotonase/enoyl-CoA hydratase family protein [Actinomycetes bacterium]MCP4961475.1 crotonase/enoyl-CoA hydratase family protein [Actinomycetes bacterium]
MKDRVTIELGDEGVADVRLDRPDKLNSLDSEMFGALIEAGDMLKADHSVRAVVLSGNGRSFCAGLDFSVFEAMAETSSGSEVGAGSGTRLTGRTTAPLEGRITHLGQQAVWTWQEMDQPVIAAVSGHALGGGCQLALGADIRLVHPETVMSVLEIRWGLIPDMCLSATLPRLVGLDVAKELCLTGRMLSGIEAADLGLATRVSEDPLAEALALAHEIASKSPDAIVRAKRLLNQADLLEPAAAFATEREYIGELIGSPNQREAVAAYFEKRAGNFLDVGSSGIEIP